MHVVGMLTHSLQSVRSGNGQHTHVWNSVEVKGKRANMPMLFRLVARRAGWFDIGLPSKLELSQVSQLDVSQQVAAAWGATYRTWCRVHG